MFQLNRSAIEVAEILQALLESMQIWRFFFGVSRVPQNADSRDSFALLRPCRERPRGRRANQAANEFATSHVNPRQSTIGVESTTGAVANDDGE
jgi:hypothetical protein